MTRRRIGGGASWMQSKWRARRVDSGGDPLTGWLHSETLRDIKADHAPGDRVEVQKRTGRAGDYEYADHSVLT